MSESRIVTVKGLTAEDLVNNNIRIVDENAILEPKATGYKLIGEFVSSGFTFAATYASIASDFSAQFLPAPAAHFLNWSSYLMGHALNRVLNRATRASFDTGAEQLGLCEGVTLRAATAVVSTGVAMGSDALLEHYNAYSSDPKSKALQQAAVGCVVNAFGRLVEARIAKCARKDEDRVLEVTISKDHSTFFGRREAERKMRQAQDGDYVQLTVNDGKKAGRT